MSEARTVRVNIGMYRRSQCGRLCWHQLRPSWRQGHVETVQCQGRSLFGVTPAWRCSRRCYDQTPGQNFYRHSANLILFVTFTFFEMSFQKNVKSHGFSWNLKKNVKYLFSNTSNSEVQCPTAKHSGRTHTKWLGWHVATRDMAVWNFQNNRRPPSEIWPTRTVPSP